MTEWHFKTAMAAVSDRSLEPRESVGTEGQKRPVVCTSPKPLSTARSVCMQSTRQLYTPMMTVSLLAHVRCIENMHNTSHMVAERRHAQATGM